MCSNVKSFEVSLPRHPAIMFMNSNKSESDIRQLVQQNRQKCSMAGTAVMNETIVNKGTQQGSYSGETQKSGQKRSR